MKKNFLSFLFLLLAPVLAVAQTATPTATHTATATPVYTPFIVGLSGFNLDQAVESPDQTLGIPYWGAEGKFIYSQATESISKGNWVFLNHHNELTLMDTTEAGGKPLRVCVANNDMNTTTKKYGWVWCGEGVFQAYVASTVGAFTPLTTTGSAGVAGIGGAAIAGCKNIQAGSASVPVTVACYTTITNIAFPTASPTPTP